MKQRKRYLIQAIAAVLQNGHITGFFNGKIYQGAGKHICVPGLNCYSCPGALGACPIGSLQAVIGGTARNVSYYVTGLILLFGVLFGRLICGFLCPFGFLQDLLYKIPAPKPKLPAKLDRRLRLGKYVMLAGVLLLPVILTDEFGIGDPFFCKYICPVGTLEGGIPLMLHSEALRNAAGFLFSWKMGILVILITASILLYRPFCKYLCPLGGAYGLLNRCSLCHMQVDEEACISCGICNQTCRMGVDVIKNIDSVECIRCGLCVEKCPAHAIHYTVGSGRNIGKN